MSEKDANQEVQEDVGRGREIVERLKRASGGTIQLSTEDIMRLTRGEDWGTRRREKGFNDSD